MLNPDSPIPLYKQLAHILEEIGEYISRRAFEITAHTGRKTITDKDIELAYKQWGKPTQAKSVFVEVFKGNSPQ